MKTRCWYSLLYLNYPFHWIVGGALNSYGMNMSISEVPTAKSAKSQPSQTVSGRFVRPLLWLLLVFSATADVIASTTHLVVLNAVFGVITLGVGTALAMHHYRARQLNRQSAGR